jgi:hypothetical protein
VEIIWVMRDFSGGRKICRPGGPDRQVGAGRQAAVLPDIKLASEKNQLSIRTGSGLCLGFRALMPPATPTEQCDEGRDA